MQLTIFQSNKGDCLLLEGAAGGRVLVDGGMAKSMRNHVRVNLSGSAPIDVIYVSHIDQDHISGVLQLLEDALEWEIFNRHGDPTLPQPDCPEPPPIDQLWHNSFHDLITENRGRIERVLTAEAPVLFGSSIEGARLLGDQMHNIAASIPEALRVSRLAKPDLLDIRVNRPPGRPDPGELLLVEEPNDAIPVGSMSFQLIGPTKKDLRKLRRGWDEWLRDDANREKTRKIRREMLDRVEEFANGERPRNPLDLGDWNGVPDLDGVTVPNTASLMFLVREGNSTILLTGDSHHGLVLEGLEEVGAVDGNGAIHVDVLKVPHHGSEHNVDEEFCRRVSADHYVFCGDGSHHNPDLGVLDMYFESRIGPTSKRALSPEGQDTSRPFTFWFSTTSHNQTAGSVRRGHYEKVEAHVESLRSNSGGRMTTEFNGGDSRALSL